MKKATEHDEPPKRANAGETLALTYNNMVELTFGFASGGPKEWGKTIGRLLQYRRGAGFVQRLLEEVEHYKRNARIDPKYLETDQCLTCLQELLNAIDEDSPDEIRFRAMKAIFLNAATERLSTRDDPLPQHLMHIARGLSSTDVLILSGSYKLAESVKDTAASLANTPMTPAAWAGGVVSFTGLRFPDIVLSRESSLVEKGLIIGNDQSNKRKFIVGAHHRLTDLGFYLCEFISGFEPDGSSASSA